MTTAAPEKKKVILKERMLQTDFQGMSFNFQTHSSRMPRMTWKLKLNYRGELKFSQRKMKVLIKIGRARN